MSLVPTTPGVMPASEPMTLRTELDLWRDAFDFAKAIANTDFVPKGLRNKPDAVMACMIKGAEIGVTALHSLSAIHIIEGRPSLSAELQRALILAQGHELWIGEDEWSVTSCTLYGKRKGSEHVAKVTWTIEDARRARLDGRPTWRTYPREMLLARASGTLGRLMFADVLAGMSYNREELEDGDLLPMLETGETTEGAVASLPVGGAEPAPSRRRTRRPATGTKPSAPRHAAEPTPVPGGPPPPLPGEDEPAPQRPQDESRPPPTTTTSRRPSTPKPAPDPGEPDSVIKGRAQTIAIHARRAGVDHHDVVSAITDGRTNSAKEISAAEATNVIAALEEIDQGYSRLEQDPQGGWSIVAIPIPEPEDSGSAPTELQNRVEEVKRRQQDAERGGQQTLNDVPPEEPPT